MKTIRVLVVGATGFCGRGVLNHLAGNERYEVWAHVRPESSSLESLKGLCEELQHKIVVCSINELSDKVGEIQPDVISSFIGTTQKKMKPLGLTYEDVDFGINHDLVQAALGMEVHPLFVYVSSMGIEWSRWSPYLRARQMVEDLLDKSGLPHVILRPGMLTGPTRTESRPMEHIGGALSDGMASVLSALGLRRTADGMMSLKAHQIGSTVRLLMEEWIANGSSQEHAKTILVHEIHELLRESL